MKKFIIRLSIYFAILALVDYGLGHLFSSMALNATRGNYGRYNYIANEVNQDMLIFGSSRATHHYNTLMLSDSLGYSCFTVGEDGNGIILNYARLLMIERRYKPKVVVWEFTKSFDIDTNDNHRYIAKLKQYYDRQGIQSIFWDVDPAERWKMMSWLYRSNSCFLTILSDCFLSLHELGQNGFRPLKGELDPIKIREKRSKETVAPDPLKQKYIQAFLEHVKGAKVIFCISPIYYGMDEEQLRPIRELSAREGYPLLDFSNDPKYVRNDLYFKDGSHLNARGADEFTLDFIKALKKGRWLE